VAVAIPDDARRLLDRPNFAHVATILPDGGPQPTPVWYVRDGDEVLFSTVRGRSKERNLRRDPRIALSVHDQEQPYVYVQLRGTATITADEGYALITGLGQRYLGMPYPWIRPGEERVVVRVTPHHVRYVCPPPERHDLLGGALW
jgi:PPOX class probable F420-dependent enzyme